MSMHNIKREIKQKPNEKISFRAGVLLPIQVIHHQKLETCQTVQQHDGYCKQIHYWPVLLLFFFLFPFHIWPCHPLIDPSRSFSTLGDPLGCLQRCWEGRSSSWRGSQCSFGAKILTSSLKFIWNIKQILIWKIPWAILQDPSGLFGEGPSQFKLIWNIKQILIF